MATILKLTPIESIKAGPSSTVLDDGTIRDPEPYKAVDVTFDDGVTVQVERPVTRAKLQAAYAAAAGKPGATIDEVSVGDVIEAASPEPVEGPL